MKKLLSLLLSCVGISATAQTNVTPGLPISRYPRVTSMDAPDIFIIARTNITPATNMGVPFLILSNDIAAALATTNYVNAATQNLGGFTAYETLTNGVRVALGTNVNWVSGVTGLLSGTSLSLGVNTAAVTNTLATTNFVLNAVTNLTGSTNFINLSVQAAKLPTTNYPGIDAGWQDWETVYYETNSDGNRATLSATWQFLIPPDYGTNSLQLLINYSLLNTNGPNSSNVIFGVTCLPFRAGTTNNIHTNSFEQFAFTAYGTNEWIPKYDGTNIVTNLVVSLGTNAQVSARDLVLLRLMRDATNDTFGGAVAVHGLQVIYTRQ